MDNVVSLADLIKIATYFKVDPLSMAVSSRMGKIEATFPLGGDVGSPVTLEVCTLLQTIERAEKESLRLIDMREAGHGIRLSFATEDPERVKKFGEAFDVANKEADLEFTCAGGLGVYSRQFVSEKHLLLLEVSQKVASIMGLDLEIMGYDQI